MLETTERKMLQRIMGLTLRDRKRSDDIRRELRVDSTAEYSWHGYAGMAICRERVRRTR